MSTGPFAAANEVPSRISTDAPAGAAVVVGATVVGADVVSTADVSGAADDVESSDDPPHAANAKIATEIEAVRTRR
jgi:hypothetical protein